MKKVLVTGANGQLATCIKDVGYTAPEHHFVFKNSTQLDITNQEQIAAVFEEEQPSFCINCAGYTAVDQAETDRSTAEKINTEGPRNLAKACKEYGLVLIHISTDFVFDGNKTNPYTETDATNPLGVYGLSKFWGEQAIIEELNEYFILRTSWLYSEYGHNFMKTMLRLQAENAEIRVVNDQVGSPTYAGDLAISIIALIKKNTQQFGCYHYSNEGATSWYGFAQKIFEFTGLSANLLPKKTAETVTAAKRPAYSVLNSNSIKNTFEIEIASWENSLRRCLHKLNA